MIEVDEGLVDWFKKHFNDFNIGQRDLNNYIKQAIGKFNEWRGRAGEDWVNIKWKTLYSWMKVLAHLALTKEEIIEIVKDPSIKKAAYDVFQSLGIADKFKEYEKGFLKPDFELGGNENIGTPEQRAKIAEAVAVFVIKLATVVWLRKKTRTTSDDTVDPTTGDKETTQSTSSDDDIDIEALKKARAELVKLREILKKGGAS